MFERFTDRARRAVVLAQEEARMLNHNYIGTEHFLLGLIHEGDGVACRVLESLGISLEAVRLGVEEIVGQGQTPPTGHIPFTPRAKRVLELTLREAESLGHVYLGTEHILLGLIREGEGVACQVLVQLGADLNRVRRQVIQLLSGQAGHSSPFTETASMRRLESEPRFERPPRDPSAFPLCPSCRMSLAGSLRFRILDAQEQAGEGVRRLLVLYCATCGVVVDSVVLPEDAG